MRKIERNFPALVCLTLFIGMNVNTVYSQPLWDLAKKNKDLLTVTTLFTAQDVRRYLSDTAGLENAVSWCKQTGITKVYIESYREGYYADREVLNRAKGRFLKDGFRVSGCVTTLGFGRRGVGGWNQAPCYSNKETPEELQKVFEFTASVFDEIMIDDFLFTDCECEDCIAARGDQLWSKYRSDLMVKMSQERILKPSRAVNKNVKIIIKYPLWYEQFQDRGYEVVRESKDYDQIYIGTETRDYDYNIKSSGDVQYNAYFIMRWLGAIGGNKTSGGWFDALGTTPKTYLEQARQTVLGDAKEIMLFCYSNLIRESNNYNGWKGTGIANVEALRKELPGLFELAKIVRGKSIKGIHVSKPPSSEPFEEPYIYSLLGMLGLPLVPDYKINEQAGSAIFPVQMLKEPGFSGTLQRMLDKGTPIIITDGLSKRLANQSLLKRENLTILKVEGKPRNLLKLTREELKPVRDKLLAPLGLQFDAPNKVGLYLFGDNFFVVENFNDEPVDVTLDIAKTSKVSKVLTLPEEGSVDLSQNKTTTKIQNLSPRSLVVVEYH
jgi:hypothetical protein